MYDSATSTWVRMSGRGPICVIELHATKNVCLVVGPYVVFSYINLSTNVLSWADMYDSATST